MITFQLKWINGGETAAVVSRQHITKSLEREMERSWGTRGSKINRGTARVGGTPEQCDGNYQAGAPYY